MSRHPWPHLKWWECGERQVVEERLDDLTKRGIPYNPGKASMYKALSRTPFDKVQVAIIGQDPYPQSETATGVAFEIPDSLPQFPASLRILLQEYSADLHYPIPRVGVLDRWTSQGVLLWNAIPTVREGLPLSHDWEEYRYLTGEIVKTLSERGIVFALLGGVARRFADEINLDRNRIVITSHPSPRGVRHSSTPLIGSRLFSTINSRLNEIHRKPIDWRLSDVGQNKIWDSDVDGGRVLPNLSGIPVPKLRKLKAPTYYKSDFEV